MEEQLISFETAKLAKDKGFRKKTKFSYKQPVVTKRGTNIKEEREYRIEKTNQYTSFTEISHPNEDYYAPTQSLLQKWLREVHDIDITIHRSFSMNKSYHYCIVPQNDYDKEHQQEVIPNRSYKEALENGLQEALKLIK